MNPRVAATGTAEATARKIAWIRDAAPERFDELELNVTVFFCVVAKDREGTAGRIAQGFGLTGSELLGSPHVLIGTVEEIMDDLHRRWEEYGFSYIVFSGDDAMAPVVKRLTGT